jgi:hypothetical protein
MSVHAHQQRCVAACVACHVIPRRVPLVTTSLGLSVFARPAAAAAFTTSASIIDQVTFKEMGMLSWLIVDVAIQWGGWAVSALLKVRGKPLAHQQLHAAVQLARSSAHCLLCRSLPDRVRRRLHAAQLPHT